MTGAVPELPELGVGITYSRDIEPLLLEEPGLVDVLEVEPQTAWIKRPGEPRPYRVQEETMQRLLSFPMRKLVHSVGTPVGGTVRPEPAQLELLRETVLRLEAPWASDHLSFNATPEFATGFFLPPRQTAAGVETVAASVADLQQALPVPIAIETGVNYLRPRPDELEDGDFVGVVAERSDCGVLLDLHNVFANALNGRQPIEDFLAQLPLERVWELHIAGGMEMDGFWLDAHSGALPDALVEIAAEVVPRLPSLKAIVFEIFPSFVPVVGLELVAEQLRRIRKLWELRAPAATAPPRRPAGPPAEADRLSPEAWERALGTLVIGRPADGGAAAELRDDPGVLLVDGLVKEFRASMVVGVLRLTSRLLMLALGTDVFRMLLEGFWSKTPPQMYSSLEAAAFADYLGELDLKVPQLAGVLAFERALMETLCDDVPRIVAFDSNPLPLLRALAEGRLPAEPGRPGLYEIEVTPDGPAGALGVELDDVQQAFPYH